MSEPRVNGVSPNTSPSRSEPGPLPNTGAITITEALNLDIKVTSRAFEEIKELGPFPTDEEIKDAFTKLEDFYKESISHYPRYINAILDRAQVHPDEARRSLEELNTFVERFQQIASAHVSPL